MPWLKDTPLELLSVNPPNVNGPNIVCADEPFNVVVLELLVNVPLFVKSPPTNRSCPLVELCVKVVPDPMVMFPIEVCEPPWRVSVPELTVTLLGVPGVDSVVPEPHSFEVA